MCIRFEYTHTYPLTIPVTGDAPSVDSVWDGGEDAVLIAEDNVILRVCMLGNTFLLRGGE